MWIANTEQTCFNLLCDSLTGKGDNYNGLLAWKNLFESLAEVTPFLGSPKTEFAKSPRVQMIGKYVCSRRERKTVHWRL